MAKARKRFYDDNQLIDSKGEVPLHVLMEGRSWGLTSLLITTTALWMVSFEKSESENKFFGLYSYLISGNAGWQAELYEYLFYSVVAILAACCCFASLIINLRPPGLFMVRFRLFISTLMLICNNLMTVVGLRDNIVSIIYKTETDIGVIVAETFLSTMLLICIIIVDVVFIKYFGCCLCFNCYAFEPVLDPKKTLEDGTADHPQVVIDNNDLDLIEENKNVIIKKSRDIVDGTTTQEESKVVTIEQEIKEEENLELIEDESEVNEIVIEENVSEIVNNTENQNNEETDTSIATSSTHSEFRKTTGIKYRKNRKWDTKRMLKVYKKEVYPKIKEMNGGTGDRSEPLLNRESNDVDLPRPEDLTWFVLSMKNPKSLFQKVIDAVKEEENFKYSVWIKSSAITTAIVLIYTAIYTMASFDRFCIDTINNLNGFNNILITLNDYLSEFGYVSDRDSQFISNVINYFMVILPVMRRTAYIGFPVGLVIAMHSLYSVVVQHKRLSCVMNFELMEHERELVSRNENQDNIIRIRNIWPELEKKYPIGQSIYFLGLITSTGVIQLQVFGFVLSFILAVFCDYRNYNTLMVMFGNYVIIFLAIFAIDFVLLHVVPDMILSDGFRIKHPRVFFFYMLSFSMVHLILGYLYALWRIIYLVFVTLFILNRMDICLTREFKSLDSGHTAFMSMLVLTRIAQNEKLEKLKSRHFRPRFFK